ncbi:MAG: NusA-like transcription termination signal-binding factor [Candidatus Hydrothermarchaeaceae archaeon]
MESLKISFDDIRNIALFEKVTGATIKGYVIDEKENKILFVVKKGDIGLAIGKKGSNIHKAERLLGRRVKVVEYSEDPADFIKNLFHPFRVLNVSFIEKEKEKIAQVGIDERDKFQAIGTKGRNLGTVKVLAKRHHKIGDVVIT